LRGQWSSAGTFGNARPEIAGGVSVALPNFDEWRASVPAVEGAAAWRRADVNVATSQGADRLPGVVAAGDFFDVLGATLVAGRTFDDGRTGASPAPSAVISERGFS
jgi:hypothetical protein